ncbi:MAG: HAMP domain-containing histidine kinase [Chloroflexi bacterium]|nr:HAMP domain-containing histidine kinase [Chloroflexota bacterium]
MTVKLRWRLFLLQLVIVTAVFTTIGIMIYLQAQSRFIANRLAQAQENVYWALTNAEPYGDLRVKDIAEIGRNLAEVPGPDYSFFFLAPDGNLVNTLSQGAPGYVPALEVLPGLAETLGKGETAVSVTNSAGSAYRTLLYVVPVSDPEGRRLGAVQVEVRLDEADLALRKLRVLLAEGFGIAFMAMAAVWFLLTRNALRPLEDVHRISGSVARGDFHARVSLPSVRDEVYEAAAAFNSMLDHIEASMQKEKMAQESMRAFLADVSHELRSPLTILTGYLDILLRGAKDSPEELQNALEGMKLTAGRMKRMTNDLLTLSRLDAGAELQMKTVALNAVCRQVFETARMIAPDKEMKFIDTEPIHVNGDEELLSRVVWNLIENAIKHTPASGRIMLSLARSGPNCIITVEDNGEGISAPELPRLFERFHKVHQTDSSGAGLGLAIVKSIVAAHGGQVTVQSTVGKGTTFTVNLPMLQSPPA